MIRGRRHHEVIVALSAAFPEAAEKLIYELNRIIPRSQIRVWHPPTNTAAMLGSKLRDLAETVRAQFLASLQPDLVHASSIFEGFADDVVTVQPARLERLPMVATCYDMIPMIRHDEYFGARGPIPTAARWYYRCANEMLLSDGLLAISESSRGEAIRHLPYPPDRVFDVQAGISPDFQPANLSAEEHAALLRRYGLRKSFILFLGAGDIRKNESGSARGIRKVAAHAARPPSAADRRARWRKRSFAGGRHAIDSTARKTSSSFPLCKKAT